MSGRFRLERPSTVWLPSRPIGDAGHYGWSGVFARFSKHTAEGSRQCLRMLRFFGSGGEIRITPHSGQCCFYFVSTSKVPPYQGAPRIMCMPVNSDGFTWIGMSRMFDLTRKPEFLNKYSGMMEAYGRK